MIHAICDFCGKDCDRTATLLSMTPFQNFARYHTDNEPYGNREKTRSFVICYECCKKHNLPNPYETYSGITRIIPKRNWPYPILNSQRLLKF